MLRIRILLSDGSRGKVESGMDFLLELPWWATLAGLGAAIGVWIYGNNRLEKKIKLGGIGLLLLTIILTIVSRAIDTPREQGVKRTHAIVAAANAEDWNKFESLLDANTQVSLIRGASNIRQIIEKQWNQHGFKSATILNTESTRSGSLITVYITVFSEASVSGRSTWEFDYERVSDGLFLSKVRAISMDGGDGNAEMIMRYFGK